MCWKRRAACVRRPFSCRCRPARSMETRPTRFPWGCDGETVAAAMDELERQPRSAPFASAAGIARVAEYVVGGRGAFASLIGGSASKGERVTALRALLGFRTLRILPPRCYSHPRTVRTGGRDAQVRDPAHPARGSRARARWLPERKR
jgi:hypothetical protein